MEPVADIQPPKPAVPGNPREPLMNQREAGAIHLRIVALAFAAWIFDFYDLILYSFLLVPVARELHLTPEQSSIALGTSLLMTALGGVIFGFLGDRFGRKPMIATTVAIYGVGTALCGFSHTLHPTDRISIDNRARDGRRMGPRTKSGCRERAGRAPRTIRSIRADGSAAGGFVGGGGGRLSRTRDRMASDVHGFRHPRRICRRRRAEVDAGERRLAAHAHRS